MFILQVFFKYIFKCLFIYLYECVVIYLIQVVYSALDIYQCLFRIIHREL